MQKGRRGFPIGTTTTNKGFGQKPRNYFRGFTSLMHTLVSIEAIPAISVPNGTAFQNINFSDYYLNSVKGILSNGNVIDLPIKWKAGSYQSLVSATYTIYGHFTLPSNVRSTITPTISVEVITLETEVQNVLTQATSDGDTHPTPINIGDINTLIKGDKTDGTFATRDIYYIMCTDGSEGFARLNYKSPSTKKLTITGGVTYTPKVGFTGNGSNGYLNTSFNTSTATNFLRNDCGMGAYVYGDVMQLGSVATGARLTLGVVTGLGVGAPVVNSEITGNTNPSFVMDWGPGYYHLYRNLSGSINCRKASIFVQQSVSDTSVAAPNANIYLLARNNAGTADSFSLGTISCFWAGANLGGTAVQINDRWATYFRRTRIKPTYTNPATIGIKLNDTFARASLGGAYVVAAGSFACDGSKLVVSGGANDFLKKCTWKYGNNSEDCTIENTFTAAAAPAANFGIGPSFTDYNGVFGKRSIVAKLDLSNGADAGKLQIFTYDGTTAVQAAVSSAIASIANNDVFNTTFSKSTVSGLVSYTFTATRVSDSATTSCTYAAILGDSRGEVALYTFGGTQHVSLMRVTFNDRTNAKLVMIGDSLTHGYAAHNLGFRYASQLNDDVVVCASSGSFTSDYSGNATILGSLRNVMDHNAQYYGLAIGGNDVAGGVSSTVWQGNLFRIASAILNEGHKIVLISPPPRGDVDVTVIRTYYIATFPNEQIITTTYSSVVNTGTGLKTQYDFGDGVHMVDDGHMTCGMAGRAQIVLY